MSFVLENGVLWSERTYEFKRQALREYFLGVKGIQLDGWYEEAPSEFNATGFMSQFLQDEPILRSSQLSDPNGRAELEKMMIDYFESIEYNQGEKFYLCRSQGMANNILLGVWCRFEDLFELLCFMKKEHHFSIINVDKGIYYRFKSEEYYFALYEKHTNPPGMDLHGRFFKVYDFVTDSVVVHVAAEPEVGPIIVEHPVFIPREKPSQ